MRFLYSKSRKATGTRTQPVHPPYNYVMAGDCAGAAATPGRGRTTIDSLSFTSCTDCNLTLAACPGLGHIGRTGDVAEWLKAAVC